MALPWKQKPKEVLISWIAALDDPVVQRDLSKWETYFVASLSFQLNKHGKISEKQETILERIYAEKTK